MQKLILTTSLLCITLSTASFASPSKPVSAFGADIKQRCLQLSSSLAQPKPFTEHADFSANIQQLESVLIPANNLLFESYLYANVSPDDAIIKAAEQCQLTTSANIETINAALALKYLGHLYAKGASSQYSFSHLGTYGPRYYSYIWSEVLARCLLEDYFADRFSGRDYLQSLFAQGGSIAMTEMFAKLYQKPLALDDIIKWVSYEKAL